MTIEQTLDEMQARCDKVTANGPYRVVEYGFDGTYSVVQDGMQVARINTFDPFSPIAKGHAEFIAHSRTDIPRLVAALRVAVDGLSGRCVNRIGGEDNLCGHCVACTTLEDVGRALRGEA